MKPDFIKELIIEIRREISSWRKTGSPAIADRIEEVIVKFVEKWRKPP